MQDGAEGGHHEARTHTAYSEAAEEQAGVAPGETWHTGVYVAFNVGEFPPGEEAKRDAQEREGPKDSKGEGETDKVVAHGPNQVSTHGTQAGDAVVVAHHLANGTLGCAVYDGHQANLTDEGPGKAPEDSGCEEDGEDGGCSVDGCGDCTEGKGETKQEREAVFAAEPLGQMVGEQTDPAVDGEDEAYLVREKADLGVIGG